MKAFLRRLFCRHTYLVWLCNIHGDEIQRCGYKRTIMLCDRCGKLVYMDAYITHDIEKGAR